MFLSKISVIGNKIFRKFIKKSVLDDIKISIALKKIGFFSKKINKKYKKYKKTTLYDSSKIIWLFWYEGIENAPDLVKKCVSSVKKNSNKKKVIIVDKNNLSNYINISTIILSKVEQGIVSLVELSNIVRLELLNKFGGLYLDATIYVSKPIPNEIFDLDFYTLHCEHPLFESVPIFDRIVKGKWAIFLLASKPHNVLIEYCRDIIISYWEKQNHSDNYFLIDLIMLYAYSHFDFMRTLIDNVPQNISNHENCFKFVNLFNRKYNPDVYNKTLKSAVFFKLSFKEKYDLKVDNSITNYNFFINQ